MEEATLSATVAEHLLSLFDPNLYGARNALETCCAAQTILRDRVAELEQERNQKRTAANNPLEESSELVKCGSDVLLLVCSFLHIEDKVQFRNSSLGLHSMLLGCAIDLTESNEIWELATIGFVMDRLVAFRKFSKRNLGYDVCGCTAARTISDLKVGARLDLAAQSDSAAHLKANSLQSIGFGRSWNIMGLRLIQESDAKMLTKLLTVIEANQVKKIAIGSFSAGILTAIGQAAERGDLTGLQEIDFHYVDLDEDDEIELGDLGTLGNFGPAFHRLNLSNSQITDISGLGRCTNICTLYLSSTQVTDVSSLSLCSSLHTLKLNRTQVVDVSALSSCSSLRTLDLSDTQVADVSALGSCISLHTLDLTETLVSEIFALGLCSSLHTLDLCGTPLVDVSALASCSSLHTLVLSGTQVVDISALGSCSSLHALDLNSSQVVDISVLGSCSNLYTLDLDYTEVVDVSALGSCSCLHTLDLNNTQVVDVSALGSCCSLHALSLRNTQVADVSALRSCSSSLHVLYLNDTQVVDVSPLGSCSSLHKLSLSNTQAVAGVSKLSSSCTVEYLRRSVRSI